jgi:hypothetical protein
MNDKITKNEEHFNEIRRKKEAENREKLNQTNRRIESEFNRAETDFIKKFRGENKR